MDKTRKNPPKKQASGKPQKASTNSDATPKGKSTDTAQTKTDQTQTKPPVPAARLTDLPKLEMPQQLNPPETSSAKKSSKQEDRLPAANRPPALKSEPTLGGPAKAPPTPPAKNPPPLPGGKAMTAPPVAGLPIPAKAVAANASAKSIKPDDTSAVKTSTAGSRPQPASSTRTMPSVTHTPVSAGSSAQARDKSGTTANSGSGVKSQLPPSGSASFTTHGNTALAISEPAISQPDNEQAPVPETKSNTDGSSHNVGSDEAAPTSRRSARRRPAGPPRDRIAANDDVPSIGGLIYALNQKPSRKPYVYAAAASGFWVVLALTFAIAFMPTNLTLANGIAGVAANPWFPTLLATIFGPVTLFFFLAVLAWRAEELHLRSTAMTEVAVRLAEPDRMAEQSVASLGQAVRRQVSFMNDAVSRALGRAGELEALVHNEVSALEHSYDENERKIRGLISELASERHSLVNTGEHFETSLHKMHVEIPQLMSQLSEQQIKLTSIIESAGLNLTQLETSLASQTGRLETSLGDRTTQLQSVLGDYTEALGTALESRTENMGTMLGSYTEALGTALGSRTSDLKLMLEDKRNTIESNVDSLSGTIDKKVSELQSTVEANTDRINTTLTDRTENLQTVFEEYALALDTTLANRAEALDSQLVERTKSLDEAFSERLRLFDESVLRSTMAIDSAVGENTKALTNAMEVHARQLGDSIAGQAAELDETLMKGINSVRNTSENISHQSIKAIEGLASQSDLLRNVSENLLNQINSVTNRFENQGQAIMRSANALETTNYKIEKSLAGRTEELNHTLDRMSGKADELSKVVEGYSSSLEGSLTVAEQRARMIASEISKETEARSRTALDDLQRVKMEASRETDKALEELRREFTNVSSEVTERLGSLTNQFTFATGAVREQAAAAARDLENEQDRLKQQLDRLPGATEETATQMRRALNDQLRALDQLSSMANRSGMPDVTQPTRRQLAPPSAAAQPPHRADPNTKGLSSLTSSLAREISERNTRNSAAMSGIGQTSARSAQPAQNTSQQEAWSLGDLLARASETNDERAAAPQFERPPAPAPEMPTAPAAPAPSSSSGQGAGLDINALSRALDPTTAANIWSRFQGGQRGFMVRSIYAPESRNLFDGIARRYRTDESFRHLIDRFLNEYQGELSEADHRDPSGNSSQQLIKSDTGRVYLVLSHASGRLV